MALSRTVERVRRGSLGRTLADVWAEEAPPARVGFVSAYDRLRLHELAAQELAACDAGDLAEALRLSEMYERAEARALGLPVGR